MTPFLVLLLAGLAFGKIYKRCELARELKYVHGLPSHQVATWVCIAEHESAYNTSITGYLSGDGSADHGLFQISDRYWCSPPGKGRGCEMSCAELEDNDITDDLKCAHVIHKEHKTLSGDGFNAWAVYQPHCKGSKSHRYIKGCFNDPGVSKPYVTDLSTNSPSTFAHGFFGTAAGRPNKQRQPFSSTSAFSPFFSSSTSDFDPSSIFTSSSTSEFTPFFPSTSTSNFRPSSFFPSSSTSNFNPPFFTSTSTSNFNPSTFFSSVVSNRPTTPNRFLIFNQPTNRPLAGGRSSVVNSSPSTTSIYTPTSTGFSRRTSTDKKLPDEPVFVINGVRWVK